MQSKWKVYSNLIGGDKMYGVYRLINTADVDHSGNRETHGGLVQTREEAAAIADKMNCEDWDRREVKA